MRFYTSLFCTALAAYGHGQVVLDGRFINERFIINTGIDLLEGELDWSISGGEPIRNYALDEPYYWVNREYMRMELEENIPLTSLSAQDNIVPFIDLVNAALDSGVVDAYKDLQFGQPYVRGTCGHVVPSSIILKIDFAFDYTARMIVPHIIGLGFEQPDGRLVNLYFPELRWALMGHNVRNGPELMRCNAYFDDGLYTAHSIDKQGLLTPSMCSNCSPQLEEQSELDALTSLFLLEEELCRHNVVRKHKSNVRVTSYSVDPVDLRVEFDRQGSIKRMEVMKDGSRLLTAAYAHGFPQGDFREFYADHGPKQEGQFIAGLREGEWTSWFPDGTLKSRRNYVNGLLHGRQLVYYPNGGLFLDYGMVNGDYSGEHATYYQDGRPKQRGMMKDGFIIGEWIYSTRINDTLRTYMDEHETSFSFPPSVWADNHITYRVTYIYEPSGEGCLLRKCIHSEISKDIE